jgi:hypothetical protein
VANTPNYNWPTPDDTDLVRDGAAAIRDLADAADATQKTFDKLTTKGDLLVHNGSGYVRLAKGTDTHVLTADAGAAAGLSWQVSTAVAGMELAGSNETGATATVGTTAQDVVTVSSLNISPEQPFLVLCNWRTVTSHQGRVGLKINSTVVAEAAAANTSIGHSGSLNAFAGTSYVYVAPRVSNFLRGLHSISVFGGTDGSPIPGVSWCNTNMPTVTVTSIAIRGQTSNASGQMQIKDVYVYTLPI